MSMRLATFKDSDTGEVFPKMADDIKRLTNNTVSLTDASGKLKSTFQIYKEIGKVYKDLDQSSQLQLNELLGGKLRGNVVSAILSNVQELDRAYQLASNSAGSAMQEYATYQDSVQYSIDRFKESVNGIYTNITNSDFLKGLINGLASFIGVVEESTDMLGGLGTAILTCGTALAVFKGQAIMGAISSLGGLAGMLVKVKTAFTALTAVISANPLGAIAVGLTAVVGAVATFKQKSKEAKEELKALGSEVNSLNSNMGQLEGAYENFRIASRSGSLVERNDALKELSTLLPEITNIMNNENLSIRTQNELIEAQIRLKREEADIKASEYANDSKKTIQSDSKEMNYAMDRLTELTYAYENFDKLSTEIAGEMAVEVLGYCYTFQDLHDMINLYYEDVLKYSESSVDFLTNTANASEEWKKKNEGLINSANQVVNTFNGASELIDELFNKEMPEINAGEGLEISDNVQSSIDSVQRLYESLGYTVAEAKEKVQELNDSMENSEDVIEIDASKTYGQCVDEIKAMNEMLQELNETQTMTPELVSDLISKYPEMGSAVFEVASAQEFLNSKIADTVTTQTIAYETMIADDANWYQARLQNAEALQAQFDAFASAFVDIHSEAYDFDVRNYKTFAEAKIGFGAYVNNAMGQFMANFVGGNADAYAVDLSNMKTLAERKAHIINAMNTQLRTLQNNLNRMANEFNEVAVNSSGEAMYGRTAGALEHYQKLAKQLKTVNAAIEDVNTSFGGYSGGFAGYTPSYGGAPSYSGSGGSGGSKGSGGSGSAGSAEKTVEDKHICPHKTHSN